MKIWKVSVYNSVKNKIEDHYFYHEFDAHAFSISKNNINIASYRELIKINGEPPRKKSEVDAEVCESNIYNGIIGFDGEDTITRGMILGFYEDCLKTFKETKALLEKL